MHLLLRRLRNWADAAKRSFRRKAVSPKQSAICNRLSISWFGGEPLLASSIVLDVGRHAFNLCEQHGVKFGAGLTTNGYLLAPELFNELISIGHNDYQITLDGDEEWHDKTRVLANRRPTFQRIWSNLETCRSAPGKFSIMLRLHVHRENVESVKRLYDMLKASLLGDPRFTVYFHKVSNLNPGTTVKEQVLGRDEYLNALEFITGDDERPAAPAGAISEEHLSGYIATRPSRTHLWFAQTEPLESALSRYLTSVIALDA